MQNFEYAIARSVDGAIELSTPESRFLAGGIDLLGEMKEYITSPKRVIDLKLIPDLDRIDTSTSTWKIGANVTIAEIARNERIRATLPGLAEAASEVGSPQIRNVATLGGNLAQHSRCWYYRHRDLRCLKRGGSTCYAREGENKYHSLFSGNPCISPIVSNLAIILAALRCEGQSATGRQRRDSHDWRTLFRCLEQPAGSHLAAAGRSDRSCGNPDTKESQHLFADQ